ncbi:hypothetical protein MLD38_040539 [Melastoma candidum]|nr:hypothetical protein MLD38_040539 [Melastoma candidum]
MKYTIVVARTADSPTTLQYLAPYTGAALAEYFMYLETQSEDISAYIPTNVSGFCLVALSPPPPARSPLPRQSLGQHWRPAP